MPILEDLIDESDETFTVSVQSVDAGTVGSTADTGLGTITDNDGAPDVLIGDATVDEAAGTASFAVTLTNPSAADITLTLTTADGSATAGADYTATSSQVTILAGTTTATGTFNVPILEDVIDESDETFTVSVLTVDAGTVGSTADTGLGTITDNDGAPDVLIGNSTVDEAAGTASFNVTLTNPSAADITLTLTTADGSATAGADYTATSSQVTILAGTTTATGSFNVPILEDLLDESDETFTVSVLSVDAGTVGSTADTGLGTITDNDAAPDVLIGNSTVDEAAGTASFNVTLTNPSAADITLTLTTADGSATAGADYTATSSQVTILAGTTTATGSFSVPISEDLLDESDETFTVSVLSVDAGTVGSTADTGLGTITDNDGAPDVLIGDATVDEAAGTASFAVTLTNPSAADITLTLTTADGSATAGADYTATTGQVTILAGTTTATGSFDVPILEDLIDESDETFTVSVLTVDAGTVGSTVDTGIGTITDNDGAPDVLIGDSTVDEAAGTASFAVTLTNPSATDITLTLTTADGSATAGADYTATSSQVTILAGTTTATGRFSVPILEDVIDESDETFTVSVLTVDAGTVGSTADTGLGTITDNDGVRNVLIGDATVDEAAGTASFAVTLTNPSAADITLTLTTADGSATAGADYTATTSQVTILAGTTTATGSFNVPISEDLIDESDETFTVSVLSVDAGTVGSTADTGLGTITDNDGAPERPDR